MRWLATLGVFMILLPTTVFAQDIELRFDLNADSYLDITDLGFRLYYPNHWTVDTGDGITVSELELDIPLLTDLENSTNAEGLFIRVLGIAAESIDDYQAMTLETASQDALDKFGTTETTRFDASVLTRRAMSMVGTNDNGRAGILTVWKQPDYLVTATLSAPNMETILDLRSSWESLLSLIEPLGALPLNEEPIMLEKADFTIRYPESWFISDDSSTETDRAIMIFEGEASFENLTPHEGSVLGIIEGTLDQSFANSPTILNNFADALATEQGFDASVIRQEYVILNQPALTLIGQTRRNEYWAIITVTIKEGVVVALIAAVPTEERLRAFEGTWTAILQSIEPLACLKLDLTVCSQG